MKQGVPGFLKVSSVMVGTVIGAGFASGQEVIRFFTQYGEKGLGSIVLSGLLFIGICYLVLSDPSRDYASYLRRLMPEVPARAMETVTILFMLFGYGAMLSGSGALMEQEWGWNFYAGLLVMAGVSMGIFLAGKSGLIWLNMLLVPVMIVMLVWICLGGIGYEMIQSASLQTAPLSIPWQELPSMRFLIDGVLYISYNLLTLIPVLCTMQSVIRDRKSAIGAAALGGGILMALSFILGLASLINYDTMKGMEIPIFAMLRDSKVQSLLCCLVLWGAMLTTAVSDGYMCIRYLRERGVPAQGAILLVVGLGYGIGCLGFSSLVGKVYPLFGALGLILLGMIFWKRLRNRQREKEQIR
ncbi:MAG: hypothetical protein ACLU6B_06605 [Lachnospirales bacterium]